MGIGNDSGLWTATDECWARWILCQVVVPKAKVNIAGERDGYLTSNCWWYCNSETLIRRYRNFLDVAGFKHLDGIVSGSLAEAMSVVVEKVGRRSATCSW